MCQDGNTRYCHSQLILLLPTLTIVSRARTIVCQSETMSLVGTLRQKMDDEAVVARARLPVALPGGCMACLDIYMHLIKLSHSSRLQNKLTPSLA